MLLEEIVEHLAVRLDAVRPEIVAHQVARFLQALLDKRQRRLGRRGIGKLVQPDLLRVGGVIAWRLVAGLAEINLLRIAPHFYREYDLHLAASQPHIVAIESFDWLDSILESPFEVRDGLAHLSDRPGFGVTFKPEAIREYRHQPD